MSCPQTFIDICKENDAQCTLTTRTINANKYQCDRAYGTFVDNECKNIPLCKWDFDETICKREEQDPDWPVMWTDSNSGYAHEHPGTGDTCSTQVANIIGYKGDAESDLPQCEENKTLGLCKDGNSKTCNTSTIGSLQGGPCDLCSKDSCWCLQKNNDPEYAKCHYTVDRAQGGLPGAGGPGGGRQGYQNSCCANLTCHPSGRCL